jgi:arylsulfatase A-like enzyme
LQRLGTGLYSVECLVKTGGPVSPELDRLAANGLKFTQGYSNSSVCSPTRFALMTARYPYRLRGGADEPINSKSKGSKVLSLPPEHPTPATTARTISTPTKRKNTKKAT